MAHQMSSLDGHRLCRTEHHIERRSASAAFHHGDAALMASVRDLVWAMRTSSPPSSSRAGGIPEMVAQFDRRGGLEGAKRLMREPRNAMACRDSGDEP